MELSFNSQTLITFLLASTRVLATLLVAPPFNGGMVPVRIRLGLAVSVGVLLASLPVADPGALPADTPSLITAVAQQVLAGLVFGFFVQLLLSAFQIAGSIIDVSAGLNSGALFDPMTQSQVAPVGLLYQLVSTVSLLTLDGHLLIMRGIMRSYEAAPIGAVNNAALAGTLSRAAGQLFIAALEVGFPVLAALMLTEVALGVASRAAPKLNIMAIGFGVKSLVLFLVLGVGLPLLADATMNLLDLGLRSGSRLIEG